MFILNEYPLQILSQDEKLSASTVYSQIKAPGTKASQSKPSGAAFQNQRPEAFYGIKIGPILAEL